MERPSLCCSSQRVAPKVAQATGSARQESRVYSAARTPARKEDSGSGKDSETTFHRATNHKRPKPEPA